MIKRNKTIIISVILLLVLLAIIFLIIRSYQSEDSQIPAQTDSSAYERFDGVYLVDFDDEGLPEKQEEITNLKELAFVISETFGSYSYEGDYRNINDLRIYMSDSMKEWADEYIKEERKDDYSGEYDVITTTPLIGKVIKLSEEEASVLVVTKREVLSDMEEINFHEGIIINFSKIDSDWKVDGIFWL